jgi:hypothetical protein
MEKFARPIESDEDLVEYLVFAYKVSEDYAKELVKKHAQGTQEGKERGSFIWYVGDMLADVEALEPNELEEDEEACENSSDE